MAMTLSERITLMTKLRQFMLGESPQWQEIKRRALLENPWFIPVYVEEAVKAIATQFLVEEKLQAWLKAYPELQKERPVEEVPEVGVIMAGNIPLVGFHDFLCVFIAGCRLRLRCSSKDRVLWQALIRLLVEWEPRFEAYVSIREQLKQCDAYIATGSNNTSRYFQQYFGKYPHIIRNSRSSIAVLDGTETEDDLRALADDIGLYFGLGCRNVTQIFVPEGYDFSRLEEALKVYDYHFHFDRYQNNYDYQLALLLLNKVPYRHLASMLLVPSTNLFAPVSVLNYQTYDSERALNEMLPEASKIQAVLSKQAGSFYEKIVNTPLGQSQRPELTDYADGKDTMAFLRDLKLS